MLQGIDIVRVAELAFKTSKHEHAHILDSAASTPTDIAGNKAADAPMHATRYLVAATAAFLPQVLHQCT